MSIIERMRKKTLPNPYEIKKEDVGSLLTSRTGDFGEVISADVGKRVYLRNGILQMENTEQMEKRKGRGWHGDSPGHRKAALKAERKGAINEPIRTGGKNMGERHHTRLDELIDSAKPTMHAMLDQALNSGALTEEMKEDNFLLAKAIITIWGRKESYAPLSPRSKKEVKNLEHFI